MKILIVGGGPAGLALANFLDTDNHDVTVIEKNRKFTTMGFGIFFFNEGKKLLRKATHDKTIHRFLHQIGLKRYCNKQGETLGDTHYNRMFHVNSYDAITSIKRKDLHTLLADHLPDTIELKMATVISHIQNSEDCAKVRLSDGTEETYDLVVGADGTHSQLREQFFSYRIKLLPWVARYFWLKTTLPRFLMEWSRDATIMLMPHKSETTVLSIEYRKVHESCTDSAIIPEELAEFYASIGLEKKTLEQCYQKSYSAPMRYVYTKQWYCNRVVLIGDAQHAMTPTLGFGTSSALEDAYELAQALNTLPDNERVEDVLRKFSKKRTRKIRVLRTINRCTDFLVYRRSRLYFRYWYKHHALAVKISQCVDWMIRIGWKYA